MLLFEQNVTQNIRPTDMAASIAFQSIVLRESDVPGAKLVYESIEKHSTIQLQRWLECRGLAKTGNRSKLTQR